MTTKVTEKTEREDKGKLDGGLPNNRQRRAADGEVLYVLMEVQRLLEAAREGRFHERAKDNQLTGISRDMLIGINELLDTILLRPANPVPSPSKP